jgi:hypothetical protein
MLSLTASGHGWKFFRTGGLVQVSLETAADLLALDQLDQKLWVALSCPTKGLELDEKTLALVDRDNDGKIAVPDVIAAVKWAAARLKDPGDLLKGARSLPVAAIADETAEGKPLLASATQVLARNGKTDAPAISVEDVTAAVAALASAPLHGDGVIPPDATDDSAVQALIKDIIATGGGVARAPGAIGVTTKTIAAFFAELAEYAERTERNAAKEIAILGESTEAACKAIAAVRAKVEDYFARERLAAFDSRAVVALNRSEEAYLEFAAKDLAVTTEELRTFPLARVEAGRALPLLEGVNPAWAGAMATLHATAVTPIFGAAKTTLTAAEWAELNAKFAAYETWLGDKAASPVEKLGLPRVKEILAGNGRAALADLAVREQALAPAFHGIGDLERLVRYHRDLHTLLRNFVNFADFYSPDREAIFQAGVLYLDSRSTELCLRVDGTNPLAAMSKAYIAFCNCTRPGSPAMTIAACITQGDSDYVFVGRNGIFYDRQGRLWYAVITSIVDNPISIRQAFWSPYKKLLRFVEEHLAKRAAAAEAASTGKLAGLAEKTVNVDQLKASPPGAPKKVDVGTVAALGVAITGAISALTLILGYVFGLRAWQYPLVLLGIVAVISGPSMVIAWLKLRQRTIGPILEANGWAINGRVKINLPFGAALTEVAELPRGAKVALGDPYEDKAAKRRKRRFVLIVLLLIVASAAAWVRWDHNRRGRYFWEQAPAGDAAP